MKKIFTLFMAILLIAGYSEVLALPGVDAGAVNTVNVRDLRLHEAVSRNRDKQNLKEKTQNAVDKTTEQNQVSSSDIKLVTFLNNNVVSSNELNNIIKKHINTPLNSQNISQITKAVMRYYQKKGYYSAVAIVSSVDYKAGEIVIDINEGSLNSVTVER